MTPRNTLTAALSALIALFAISCGNGQEQAETGMPEMEQQAFTNITDIFPEGANLELVTEGYEFDTAGSPLWVDGEIFFTNNQFEPKEDSRTVKMTAAGEYVLLREDNGVTTTMQHSGGGTILCCEMVGHRVIEMDYSGEVIGVVAGEYNGVRLDGPNDLVVDAKGGIYFTDSQYPPEDLMQDTPAVYYVTPGGEVIRVIDDVAFPNGVALSPAGSTMYLCNTNAPYLLAYDVNPDGTVSNGRNFVRLQLTEANEESGVSGSDGICVDSAGNIYVATTQGIGIQVYTPDAEYLGNITLPVATNNVNFGGDDLMTLYVSALDGIYKVDALVAGLPQPME